MPETTWGAYSSSGCHGGIVPFTPYLALASTAAGAAAETAARSWGWEFGHNSACCDSARRVRAAT